MIETTGTMGAVSMTFEMATPKAPMAMPIEPQISRGLRPSFSTENTATRVNDMLTMPMMTVCTIGLPMFIDSNMRGA